MRGFSLTVDQLAPRVVWVKLCGELDSSRSLLLEEELRAVEATHPEAVVIDLRELGFVDSSALGRLLSARRRALRGGWRLLVVRGGQAVQRLLALAALDRALELIDDPSDALTALAR